MTHIAIEEAQALAGRALTGRGGERIGSIAGPLGGADEGLATWLAVDVDDAGRRAVIPVVDLVVGPDAVEVPYARYQVLEAPQVESDSVEGHEDHALRAWYGLPAIDGSTSEGRPQFRHPGLDLD